MYRLDALDGSVVWRLGGNASSFHMREFGFSAQHDARILSEADDGTIIISLFNNAFNGDKETANCSSALLIELDTRRMNARLVQQWFPMEDELAPNQGSIQHLSGSGNVLVSWGMIAEFTKFGARGERQLEMAFVDKITKSYRVQKTAWMLCTYMHGTTRATRIFG